jgi:hypothetical protein
MIDTTNAANAALEVLEQYREEGVVLTNAIEKLRAQPDALAGLLGHLDATDPNRLAAGFVALREHIVATRQAMDPAVDFLDKAIEELGHRPPYAEKSGAQRELAEEGP